MSVKRMLTALIAAVAMTSAVACAATRTQKSPGEQIDDMVVLGNVKAALIADPVTKARQIDVEVHRGVVQLNGFVDSNSERSQATIVATGVEGVMEVRNNLAIGTAQTAGEYLDDATLTAKVKAALIQSPETKAHQINVETENGVVQLSGFVNSEAARHAATNVARSVKGVKDVRNELSVKTS